MKLPEILKRKGGTKLEWEELIMSLVIAAVGFILIYIGTK